MLNIKRIDRVTNISIYIKLDQSNTTCWESQIKLLGHIFRLPVEEPCREYALYVLKHAMERENLEGSEACS